MDKLAECSLCGKQVPEWQLSPRDKECAKCVADDRASDMSVGDLGGR